MTPRFRLYLDFDGAVNAENPAFLEILNAVAPANDNHLLAEGTILTFAPDVVARLSGILEKYNVELVWATTWNHTEAILSVPPVIGGLHNGRVLPARLNLTAKDKMEWTQWKADGIIADQSENPAAFIWIDDNAPRYHAELVSGTVKAEHLIIIPDSDSGLTENNLSLIEQFLENAA